MIASTRRSRRTFSPRRTLAAAAVLTLGLAACNGDDNGDTPDPDDPEVEAPVDDGATDEGADDGPEEPQTAPEFEDLEDGEVVPGVFLDVPVAEDFPVQAQPTPVGSAFVAALTDQTGAVSLNVEFDGQSVDELVSGIDELVEAGQAEITEGPDEIEVDGADEAVRVELASPEGGATATGIFASADGHAISLAIEVTDDADVDIEQIIDSLRIEADRLELAGTMEMPDGTAPDGTAPDGGEVEVPLDPEDEGVDPEGGVDDADADTTDDDNDGS